MVPKHPQWTSHSPFSHKAPPAVQMPGGKDEASGELAMAGVPLCPCFSRGCFWDVIRKMPRAAIFATGRRRPHGLQFWGDTGCQSLLIMSAVTF